MPSKTIPIGEIVRNAAVFNFRNRNAVDEQDLLAAVDRLFGLLAERRIDYVLVGGIALLQYVEGRNTEDIDLIVAVSALEKLPEIEITGRRTSFAQGRLDALQVDFLLTSNRLFRRVQRAYTMQQQFGEYMIPCASVEGLLLKLYALPALYRQGNFARVGLYENDIATLIQHYRPPLEPLLAEVAKYLSDSDLLSVRQILQDIQQRIERFESGRENQVD